MNRFQRCASNYAYYNYLNRYSPAMLRTYQSGRYYNSGRSGSFTTLVHKMAADHINYEEDFNLRYKTPPVINNLAMRLAWYWFVISTLMISFSLGDMAKLFNPQEYAYASRPQDNPEQIARYETLYMVQRRPHLWFKTIIIIYKWEDQFLLRKLLILFSTLGSNFISFFRSFFLFSNSPSLLIDSFSDYFSESWLSYYFCLGDEINVRLSCPDNIFPVNITPC